MSQIVTLRYSLSRLAGLPSCRLTSCRSSVAICRLLVSICRLLPFPAVSRRLWLHSVGRPLQSVAFCCFPPFSAASCLLLPFSAAFGCIPPAFRSRFSRHICTPQVPDRRITIRVFCEFRNRFSQKQIPPDSGGLAVAPCVCAV